MSSRIFLVLVISMSALVAVNYWTVFRLLRHLEEQDPGEWKALGSPVPGGGHSIRQSILLFGFVWRRRLPDELDKEMLRLIRFARVLHIAGAMVVTAGIVNFLVAVLVR